MRNAKSSKKDTTEVLVLTAMLTALVAVLQLLGSFIRLGPFSISLVLIPIVIGAASCGIIAGAWLGLVFACMVFVTGDAALFLGINIPGTIVTVLLKGILAGLFAALVYKALEKVNEFFATVVAAVVCPIVNTGIFLIGCRLFFMDWVLEQSAETGQSAIAFMFLVLAGGNFLFELGTNIILSPVVVKLLNIRKKKK